jgi:hypothetical protein
MSCDEIKVEDIKKALLPKAVIKQMQKVSKELTVKPDWKTSLLIWLSINPEFAGIHFIVVPSPEGYKDHYTLMARCGNYQTSIPIGMTFLPVPKDELNRIRYRVSLLRMESN